jgi:hypothetical protein
MDGARRFEALPEATKDLCESCLVSGIVGRDRGGVSVAYGKPFAGDAHRVVSETSFETFVAFQEYFAIFYWDSLYRDGVRAGKLPAGRIQIFDLSGFGFSSIARAWRAMPYINKWVKSYPDGEALDGCRLGVVCNVNPMIAALCKAVFSLMTKEARARVRLFSGSTSERERFRKELSEHVEPQQVPANFGGESTEEWPFTWGR